MTAYLVITRTDGTMVSSEYQIDFSNNQYMENPFPGRPALKSGKNPLFELESYSLGVSTDVTVGSKAGPTAGKPDFGDLAVMRKLDVASSAVFTRLVGGKSVKFADVLLTKQTGGSSAEAVYSAFGLGNVLFSSQHWSGAGDEGTTESVKFACQRLWTAYRMQKPDGSFAAWVIEGWDRTANRPL